MVKRVRSIRPCSTRRICVSPVWGEAAGVNASVFLEVDLPVAVWVSAALSLDSQAPGRHEGRQLA